MKKLNSTAQMLIALALGIVCGLAFGEKMAVIAPLGNIFINLIKMLVIPIVMCSIITSTASMSDINKLGRVGSKMMFLYISTTAVAASIGLVLASITKLGQGVALEVADEVAATPLSLLDILYNIVPSNIFSAMANFETLPCIVFSLLFGVALIMIGEKANPVLSLLNACSEALNQMVSLIMKIAPIGIFALVSSGLGQYGAEIFAALGKYLVLCYIGVPILAVLYLVLLKLFGGLSVKKFLSGGLKIFLTAFTTRSSAATLPLNIEVTTKEFDVPEEIAKFTLPIGCTINMNGAALGMTMKAILAGYIYGSPLSISQCAIAVVISTLSGIGMPGIPNASLVFNVLLFTTLGFPNGALIGMLASVESLEDMVQTAGNVLGDSACAVLIANSERKRERKKNNVL
ncbi:MAG: dicarboxylate/amino acid:cation symporter [Lachnospiraceae bacterium]|nr:dicarboxylate/amino acid:cation symporter [Lachnospiraceae bacterium]